MIKSFLFWFWRFVPLPFFIRYGLIWVFNQKFLIGVDGLIVSEDNKCLLFKHTYRKEYPWGLPSGYLKKGEGPDQALRREIYEESGIKVRITGLLEAYQSQQMPRIGLVYKGELMDAYQFIPSHEVQEAWFFAVDELPEISPNQLSIVEKYCGVSRHSG